MIAILTAAAVALIVTLLGTPLLINFLHRRQYGQFIREDGPQAHYVKRGTPTMGGLVIIVATLLGYAVANLIELRTPRPSGILLLLLFVGLGCVGFLDDFSKISHERSLGLTPLQKIVGQGLIGAVFGWLGLHFANANGITPASTQISFARDTAIDLAKLGAIAGVIIFVIWCAFLVVAWSNAVNLTDGLDGLAGGSSAMVFGAYTLIGLWQSYQSCEVAQSTCYSVRDPRDLTMIAAALMGACFGFLWWNASPAKIFMGDTGSLALGGAFAGLSILTRTELLAVIIGLLFVVEVVSVMIQVACFKTTGKRPFRMTPIHHHFELKGWTEVNVVIRFWIVVGLCVVLGLGIFYAEYWIG